MEKSNSFSSFCDLFKAVSQKNGEKAAVAFNRQAISYSQLDARSTQLAKILAYKGVKREEIVALGLFNDVDLVVALLAIWKANGVYLPIDPNCPTERTKMIFEDARPRILLTKRALAGMFDFFEGEIHFVDEVQGLDPQVSLERSSPEDLAYVMYTSGTTGRPKGIMVEQTGLKHAALAYSELHPGKPTSLVCGSISFDTSLLTIVYTLISGGKICLYDNRGGIDVRHPGEILDIIGENQVQFLLTMPSFYSRLLDEGKTLLSLRNVDLCGEDISRDLIERHTRIAPNAFLHNAYGPTEYAMGVTAAMIFNPKTHEVAEVSIGKSFSSNKIYILDSNFGEVNACEKGEIFVGGPGLARGYKNLEGLNKEKFVLLNSLETTPVRLYRTGDFGYYLPNGDIVFTGRKDLQLKINGHRVELEEIELVANKCPGLMKAIAIANEHPHEGILLSLFFSASDHLSEEKLCNHLKKRLPPYMLPSTYNRVESWPMLANGKLDRKALEN